MSSYTIYANARIQTYFLYNDTQENTNLCLLISKCIYFKSVSFWQKCYMFLRQYLFQINLLRRTGFSQ